MNKLYHHRIGWNVIIHPCVNCGFVVRLWMSNYIPRHYINIITFPRRSVSAALGRSSEMSWHFVCWIYHISSKSSTPLFIRASIIAYMNWGAPSSTNVTLLQIGRGLVEDTKRQRTIYCAKIHIWHKCTNTVPKKPFCLWHCICPHPGRSSCT